MTAASMISGILEKYFISVETKRKHFSKWFQYDTFFIYSYYLN